MNTLVLTVDQICNYIKTTEYYGNKELCQNTKAVVYCVNESGVISHRKSKPKKDSGLLVVFNDTDTKYNSNFGQTDFNKSVSCNFETGEVKQIYPQKSIVFGDDIIAVEVTNNFTNTEKNTIFSVYLDDKKNYYYHFQSNCTDLLEKCFANENKKTVIGVYGGIKLDYTFSISTPKEYLFDKYSGTHNYIDIFIAEGKPYVINNGLDNNIETLIKTVPYTIIKENEYAKICVIKSLIIGLPKYDFYKKEFGNFEGVAKDYYFIINKEDNKAYSFKIYRKEDVELETYFNNENSFCVNKYEKEMLVYMFYDGYFETISVFDKHFYQLSDTRWHTYSMVDSYKSEESRSNITKEEAFN